jgi:hypothetical protein
LNNRNEHLIRLTDRYFNLFFRSLLKAYASFQLNITTASGYAHKQNELGSSSGESISPACFSNFELITRKPNYFTSLNGSSAIWYAYERFDLIGQTKSVSYFQSRSDDLDFEPSCANTSPSDTKTKQRMLGVNKCYLITRVDAQTNRKISDFYDCDCRSEEANVSCSYNFWSREENSNRAGSYEDLGRVSDDDETAGARSCADSSEFACFNNGTCVDSVLPVVGVSQLPYACICPSSYTGTRFVNFVVLFLS